MLSARARGGTARSCNESAARSWRISPPLPTNHPLMSPAQSIAPGGGPRGAPGNEGSHAWRETPRAPPPESLAELQTRERRWQHVTSPLACNPLKTRSFLMHTSGSGSRGLVIARPTWASCGARGGIVCSIWQPGRSRGDTVHHCGAEKRSSWTPHASIASCAWSPRVCRGPRAGGWSMVLLCWGSGEPACLPCPMLRRRSAGKSRPFA